MDISDDAFFRSTLKVGVVYYFRAPDIITTEIPHYFIVLDIAENDIVTMSYTTTQVEKRLKHIKFNKFPESTLVEIRPDSDNGFTKPSYIDCNNSISQRPKDYLKRIYNDSSLEVKGKVSSQALKDIYQGILNSPAIARNIQNIFKNRI